MLEIQLLNYRLSLLYGTIKTESHKHILTSSLSQLGLDSTGYWLKIDDNAYVWPGLVTLMNFIRKVDHQVTTQLNNDDSPV